jgi:hypothetical protein
VSAFRRPKTCTEAEMLPAYRFIVGGFKYLVWPAAELAFHIGLGAG